MSESFEMQNLARSCHELLILATLRPGQMHGYQIALEIEERSNGFFTFNHGTLYPILHQLEKQGLIHGSWSEGEGRRRKEYALTVAGRAALRARAGEWTTFVDQLSALVWEGGDQPVRSQAAAGGA